MGKNYLEGAIDLHFHAGCEDQPFEALESIIDRGY
jgi:hypothetical protein